MYLINIKDFIIPSLHSLENLGGKAWLSDVEDEFYKCYARYLSSEKDWQTTTPNHNKPLWRDYCGSRVAYHHLLPNAYITVERHGRKGSMWIITQSGQELIR